VDIRYRLEEDGCALYRVCVGVLTAPIRATQIENQ